MFVLGYWFLLCPDGSVCILIKLDCLNTVCTDTQQPSFVSTVHKMSRCLNAVKNVLFRSFSTPMYASELWCNFRKSCMQRLRVAYNFGCRALYNLPWRASVSSHQVQCNIPTFEALLRKYKYQKPCKPYQSLFAKSCATLNVQRSHLWLNWLTKIVYLKPSSVFSELQFRREFQRTRATLSGEGQDFINN